MQKRMPDASKWGLTKDRHLQTIRQAFRLGRPA